MKRILFAVFVLCVTGTRIEIPPARAAEPDYPVFDRLTIPASILPPGYGLRPGRAWPKHEANPLVTTDSDVIRFISVWFMMSVRDEDAEEKELDHEASMKKIDEFTTSLDSYVRAAYLAMYLPQQGKGSDEIGVMALLLRPECDVLDGMSEGIFMDNLIFLKADTLAVYAFTDIRSDTLVQSMLGYFERQLKK